MHFHEQNPFFPLFSFPVQYQQPRQAAPVQAGASSTPGAAPSPAASGLFPAQAASPGADACFA